MLRNETKLVILNELMNKREFTPMKIETMFWNLENNYFKKFIIIIINKTKVIK